MAFRLHGFSDMLERPVGDGHLSNFLNETRILLLGTQVFLGFLATLPFAQRFATLDYPRRVVYLSTFATTLIALVLFVVPATYHRIARPVRRKDRFKAFANRFVIAGLVPLSLSMVLVSYLIAYVVVPAVAPYLAVAVLLLVTGVWWAAPLLRLHDHYPGFEGRS